jgi:hypothetical protein
MNKLKKLLLNNLKMIIMINLLICLQIYLNLVLLKNNYEIFYFIYKKRKITFSLN